MTMAKTLKINCPQCGAPLRSKLDSPRDAAFCSCSAWELEIFPAALERPEAARTESALSGESTCFFHPKKKAAVVCDDCGRFLCELCRIELSDRNLCPSCLQRQQEGGAEQDLENKRMLYGDIALSLAFFPILLFGFPTVVTAPLALILSIYYWNRPGSLVHNTRGRLIAAMVISSLTIVVWLALAIWVWGR